MRFRIRPRRLSQVARSGIHRVLWLPLRRKTERRRIGEERKSDRSSARRSAGRYQPATSRRGCGDDSFKVATRFRVVGRHQQRRMVNFWQRRMDDNGDL